MIVIDYKDADALMNLIIAMQRDNSVAENTVIKITGIYRKGDNMVAPYIMEYRSDGNEIGMEIVFDDEPEDLPSGAVVEITGYAKKGANYTELHIKEGGMRLAENIKE